MKEQEKAKIFLSEERGCTQADWFRSYHTFNFDTFQHRHKKPFAGLYVLNDDTLAGGRSFSLHIPESTTVMLLPIVGALHYRDAQGREGLVNAGEMVLLQLKPHDTLELTNPYENELVNFLQLWIRSDAEAAAPRLLTFDLEAGKNKLLPLCGGGSFRGETEAYPRVQIGKFAGRKEAVYGTGDPVHSLFAYVIQGAFEVQGRLLQARDGLGMWDGVDEIALEALSNEAILMLIEPGLH